MPKTNDIESVLRNTYEAQNGCWVWEGAFSTSGYGKVTVNYKTMSAHRYVYEELIGPIPTGLVLDHKCKNKCCVNPEHLEPVTQKENVRRYKEDITHCIRKHPLSGSNLYMTPDGRRQCRICIGIRGGY